MCVRRQGTNDDTTGATGKRMIFGYPLLAIVYFFFSFLFCFLIILLSFRTEGRKSKSILYALSSNVKQR